MVADMSNLGNKIYFFAVTMVVGYAASVASRRIIKVNLGVPASMESAGKMAVVLGACAVGVEYAQEQKWIPTDPFKKG